MSDYPAVCKTHHLKMVYDFASEAHAEVKQLRKYTNEPYIVHPAAVAGIIATVPNHTEAMIAIAIMHDVVEDTNRTTQDIRELFGDEEADGVHWLTDCPKTTGNRKQRKAINRERLSRAPPYIQTIKLGDIIHNTSDIFQHDPQFAATYRREILELLGVMKCGSPTLYERAIYQLSRRF